MKKILSLLLLLNAVINFVHAQPACNPKGDFSFSRNPCLPYEVTFTTNAAAFTNIRWDFGDGNNSTGLATVTNTYVNPGNYQVILIADYAACSDTIRKNITIDIQTDNQLISTADTTICIGTTKQIITTPGLNFCWIPSTYLNNPNVANPISAPTQSITYYLQSLITGSNLIQNGDFSAGNTGFTSQYFYTSNNTTDAEYFVGPSPQAWYFAHHPCTDHTTGNGNMLLVNGSATPNLEVWRTTVSVTPNTNYSFSVWICSISNPNPAQLAFSINGNSIGGLINATLPTCTWVQFYTTWNSGNATTAAISVINKNTVFFGNDFALDDISFAPFTVKRDSVRINVDNPVVTTNNDAIICEGTPVQLTTTGAAAYSWSPATGLSNAAIGNPVATPAVTTQYIVTGTTSNNCTAKDTVVITVNPKPVVTITNDTTICQNASVQLLATGGTSYVWSPAGSLNNPAIANPVATPATNTKYFVTVTNAANCSTIDSVSVAVRAVNNFAVNPPVDVCLLNTVQLNASGGDLYSWNPAASLDNPAIANPFASPVSTTPYSVTITDTVCNNMATLSTTVTVLPLPVITASSSNDIDCSNNQSQLMATGAVQYSWSPAASLSNAFIVNPVATPLTTTEYIVTGEDNNGCTNKDSVLVSVTNTNAGGYLMPTGFTPNGDGINDCYGIKYWGQILELEFSIYNRWGERVFYSSNPADCWNGTYKGVRQSAAVYIYMIKAKTTCGEAFRKGTFTLIR
ncbi:MAG TPA: gliding motility-associated C-terminal domain-containing protein [Chitinophagaceae bacterium]|nr:gliding motility-associated C-terminal domain-containing protein [Chitinophagaceae bacterium]